MLEGVWTGLDRWARIPGLPKDRCVLLIDRKPRKLRNNRSDRCRGLWCLALLVPAQAAVIGWGWSDVHHSMEPHVKGEGAVKKR